MSGLKWATIKDCLIVQLLSIDSSVIALFATTALASTVARTATVRRAPGGCSVVKQNLTTALHGSGHAS